MEPAAIAAEVLAALDESRRIEPFSKRPGGLSLEEAARVTAELRLLREARGWRRVGRKIGFTNRGIWDEYGVHAPIWGDMWDRTVREVAPGTTVSLGRLAEPRIEPEIVLGLSGDLHAGMDEADIAARVGWVAHGFEIVQSVYPGWRFAPADCVADGGLHGMLLLGPRKAVPEGTVRGLAESLAAVTVSLFCDGAPIDDGVGANALDGPVRALAHLAGVLAADRFNPPLASGEMITTGTLTRAFPVRPGERWTTRVEGMGLAGLDVVFS